MRPFFFFLFFIIFLFFSIYYANATLNVSPGKLYFESETGKQECQNILLSSQDYSGKIRIRDIWSEDVNETNLNQYNLTAEELGINISYQESISNFNGTKEVEVCILGTEVINNTRGAIIFTPEANSNILVEVGTWLIVNITPSTSQPQQPQQAQPSYSSGGGSKQKQVQNETNSSIKTNISSSTSIENTTEQEKTYEPMAEVIDGGYNGNNSDNGNETQTSLQSAQQENNGGITGATVGTGSKSISGIIIGVVVLLIIGIGLTIYNHQRIKKQKLMGYR